MKIYKIDPLNKKRPLMLVRGTRLPVSFPDSIAERMAKSLKANCRGVFATINGDLDQSIMTMGVVTVHEANEDNNTLVVLTEGHSNNHIKWKGRLDTDFKFMIDYKGSIAGQQYGGSDIYYTGPYKDLRNFVTNVVPYTGQPLVAANAKQWYSYTTPEGVALTFRGCIQAPIKEGTDFVGLKIDSIKYKGLDTNQNFRITLDCDSAISLGLRNGMSAEAKPINRIIGIGWLQFVATDDLISHIKVFNRDEGNGDAAISKRGTYDGFTYNATLEPISTHHGYTSMASYESPFEFNIKSGSALENSVIANPSGFACEASGYDMSGLDNTFPMAREVSSVLDGEPTVVNNLNNYSKNVIVVRLSSVGVREQLHLDFSDSITATGPIVFFSMNAEPLGTASPDSSNKSFDVDIPEGDDVFAFFNLAHQTEGTVTISRKTKQPTPGFYSSDGNLIKAMTKEEVERDYNYDYSNNDNNTFPSATNPSVRAATSFLWPAGVTKIGKYAFGNCKGLTSITIPNTVTEIGPNTFMSCSALTSVEIPNTVTVIGNGAFRECSALTSIVIPEGVTKIESGTFYDCSSLTSVTIPDTVTEIEYYAFEGCTSLNPLVVPSTVTKIGMDAFLVVPKVIYNGTATGSPWGAKEVAAPPQTPGFYSADGSLIKAMTKKDVEVSYGVAPSSDHPEIKNATKFVWPEGVTKVGNCVFMGCTGLTSVTIPSTVTSIKVEAFRDCTSLNSLTIPNTVTNIWHDAFTGCTSLNPLTVPNTVTTISANAFKDVPKVIYNGTATGSPWGALAVAAS